MLNDFISIELLMTFTGLVVALGIIVQFTKSIIKSTFTDQAVRIYAFTWALALTLLTSWFQGRFDVTGREIAATLLLVLLNSILVTMAAIGGYEVLSDPKATKTK
jgi:hypothetical protein